MSGPPKIFDRRLYAQRRLRARGTDFLVGEAAAQIAERAAAVNRRFLRALDISSRHAAFEVLKPVAEHWTRTRLSGSGGDLIADEEALPFAPASFDLVTSVHSLHAVNDLPGALLQVRHVLRPDGLFLAALFGGDTLRELRQAFAAAESDIAGGITPRVAPFADVRDLGALLQRGGFALPVADVERTVVHYRDPSSLFQDLRALGESNPLAGRSRSVLRRDVLAAALADYQQANSEGGGRLKATFDVIYLTGWSPHESQQRPLAAGSAHTRLADGLRNRELPGTT